MSFSAEDLVGTGADQHTLQSLCKKANDIDDSIKMEADVPSKLADGILPVLNLGLWMDNNQVGYTFYQKPCTSPYAVIYSSALSKKQKRETNQSISAFDGRLMMHILVMIMSHLEPNFPNPK